MNIKIGIAVVATILVMSSSTYLLTQTHFACNEKEKKCCNVSGKHCCSAKKMGTKADSSHTDIDVTKVSHH